MLSPSGYQLFLFHFPLHMQENIRSDIRDRQCGWSMLLPLKNSNLDKPWRKCHEKIGILDLFQVCKAQMFLLATACLKLRRAGGLENCSKT